MRGFPTGGVGNPRAPSIDRPGLGSYAPAMNSMTGYGRAEAQEGGLRCVVEINSVNRRGREVAVSGPRELPGLEATVREAIGERFSRGRVAVAVQVENRSAGQITAHLDTARAEALVVEARALRDRLGLTGDISLDALLAAPGVVREEAATPDLETLRPVLDRALNQAFAAMLEMRAREGAYLSADLKTRLEVLGLLCEAVRKLAARVPERYRRALRERMATAGVELGLDEERLAREAAIFADRSDISEELTRLESHLQQFHALIDSKEAGPVGRKMDFLTQELGRELNTLSVKANDSEIAQLVVDAKTEAEKIREQVQNIE